MDYLRLEMTTKDKTERRRSTQDLASERIAKEEEDAGRITVG